MDFDTRCAMAEKFGEEIRATIKKFTNIDTFDLHK